MVSESAATFEALLPGIQLAVFEVLWAAEPQLNHISFEQDAEVLRIHFEWKVSPAAEARQNAEYLMQEIIDIAFEGQVPVTHFASSEMSAPDHYGEVMSESIFRAIATSHAPWRLEQGH